MIMKKILYILVIIISFIFINKVSAYTEYKIGDIVPYNGMDFYVIKDSSSAEDSVTMIKAEPLTVEEVNRYGAGHVNRYTSDSVGTAYDYNGYGGMAYYTSENCGYINNEWVKTGCTNTYAQSEIKYLLDAWKIAQAPAATEARLMTYDEFTDNTELGQICTGSCYNAIAPKYDWMYNNNFWYWLGTPYTDSSSDVWFVSSNGALQSHNVNYNSGVVYPVIVLKKTVLGDDDENIVDNIDNETVDDKTIEKDISNKPNESKTTVKVDNTYMSSSIMLIIAGLIIASISVFVLYRFRNKSIK